MRSLPHSFGSVQVNRACYREHPGRVLRPLSLSLGRPRSLPAETGRENRFRSSNAMPPMMATDLGNTAFNIASIVGGDASENCLLPQQALF